MNDSLVMPDVGNGMIEQELTGSIIDAFHAVYNRLGYGFLETVYAGALQYELELRGHKAKREATIDVWYKRRLVARTRADMVVDDRVVVELKASRKLPDEAAQQLSNYIKASRVKVGLLLHFGPRSPQVYRYVSIRDPSRV